MAAIHTHDTALPPPCLTDNAVSFVSCGVPYLRHILLCNQWFTPFYKTFVFAFMKASFNCRFWGYAILSEGVTDLVRYCEGFFLLLLSWTAYSFFLRKHQIIHVVAPDTHFIIKEQNNRCHMAINFFLSQLSNYFWDSEDGILWSTCIPKSVYCYHYFSLINVSCLGTTEVK